MQSIDSLNKIRAENKTDERQYIYFIQSFLKNEEISLEEANQIVGVLGESWPYF